MNSIHADLFITRADIVKRLRDLGVPPASRIVDAVEASLCNTAYAYAVAQFQDLTADGVDSILEGDDD